MDHDTSIFAMFNGIRPMARALNEPSSNVAAWKKVGRIPAEKQPHVLAVGLNLGLPITTEHVVFPLGRPPATCDDLPPMPAPVAGNRPVKTPPTAAQAVPNI